MSRGADPGMYQQRSGVLLLHDEPDVKNDNAACNRLLGNPLGVHPGEQGINGLIDGVVMLEDGVEFGDLQYPAHPPPGAGEPEVMACGLTCPIRPDYGAERSRVEERDQRQVQHRVAFFDKGAEPVPENRRVVYVYLTGRLTDLTAASLADLKVKLSHSASPVRRNQ